GKNKSSEPEQSVLASVIEVKGWKAVGNKFVGGTIKSISLIESEPAEEPKELNESINQNIDFEITNLKENTKGEQGELF
ncbi:MAG: hypothetical protein KDC60_03675, partial [Bacteroidetes bacterium]|nr:hypothetical protein [Bacteroidota bacterium]